MGWRVLPPGTLQRFTDTDFAAYELAWPRVFMTGDGHRTPAFTWTEKCQGVKDFFTHALAEDRLYAYVEVRPSTVTAILVPPFLAQLYGKGRIIGWELPLFERLQPSMNKSLEVAQLEIKSLDELKPVLSEFDKLICAVPEILRTNKTLDETTFKHVGEIMKCITKYEKQLAAFNVDDVKNLQKAALNYFNACMGLRCSAAYHQAVGDTIQRSMLKAGPGSIHLITCGDSHLTCTDPLQQFIELNVLDSIGWIDASAG